MCDVLWIIASSLGSQLPRYFEVIKEHKTQKVNSKKTSDEVVNDIVCVLKKDMERRLKNGESSI